MTQPPGPRQTAQDQRNAAQGPQPITAADDAVLKQYDATYANARQDKLRQAQALTQAQQAVNELRERQRGAGALELEALNEAMATAEARLSRAEQTYNQAAVNEAKAAADRNEAYAKAAQSGDPQVRALAAATVQKAQLDADRAKQELDDWMAAAPERKAAVAATQRVAGLQADKAQLDLDFQRETEPTRKATLQKGLESAQQAIDQAALELETARQVAPTVVARAQQQVAAGDIGNQTAQATLDDLLRRIRQAPTDEQARTALEQALAQGQANLAATQTATGRQQALLPGELAQQEAATDATRTATAAAKLGGLANLDDYITAQKDAIARGMITADQANQALQARIAGTDVFSASQAADEALRARTGEQITQRGQDASLAATRTGTLGSMATAGLGQFAALNATVPPGSDAAGRGLLGWLTGAEQMVNRQGAPPPRVESAPLPQFLQGFAGGQQQPGPVNATPTGAGQVIINIGGGGAQYGVGSAQQPNSPSNNFQTNEPGVRNSIVPSAQPQQAPALLNPLRPATPADVEQVWGRGLGAAAGQAGRIR